MGNHFIWQLLPLILILYNKFKKVNLNFGKTFGIPNSHLFLDFYFPGDWNLLNSNLFPIFQNGRFIPIPTKGRGLRKELILGLQGRKDFQLPFGGRLSKRGEKTKLDWRILEPRIPFRRGIYSHYFGNFGFPI